MMPALSARIIAMIVGALLLIGLIAFGVTQCQKRQSQASQSRVDKGQAGAASDSAKDAIGTVSSAGQREAGSEELTRSNEREIRGAEGAGERIGPGVDYAGRAALCRRAAYANDPKCQIFRKER
jgi:predicted lipid-binding transport protein (Tim44 family)